MWRARFTIVSRTSPNDRSSLRVALLNQSRSAAHEFESAQSIKGAALYAELDSPNATWVSPGSQTFPPNTIFKERYNTGVAIIRAGTCNYKFDWYGSNM